MNAFWVIILVTVFSDGKVESVLQYPNKPEYNNQKDCESSGQAIMDDMQTKIGSNNGIVYFRCESIPLDTIGSAFGKKGTNT